VTNTGAIAYQWYIDGVAAEDISGKISGAQTNELTLSNLVSPTDNGKTVFLRATYDGSAYQSEEGAITAGIAASTGNGVNQPLDTDTSSVSIVVVNPTITIDRQPLDSTIGVGEGLDTTFNVLASVSDDSELTYQWRQNGIALSDGTNAQGTVLGANTPSLRLSSFSTVGISSISATISHPTAGNSPLTSDTVTFFVVPARPIIKWNLISQSGLRLRAGEINFNLGSNTSGTLIGDFRFPNSVYSLHSPEENIRVRMRLRAPAGRSYLSGGIGGVGGLGAISQFDVTLEKNVEYILVLGSQDSPTGGRNGGGGGCFFYKKGVLLVAVGGGGAGGRVTDKGWNRSFNRGGNGGGIGIAGENGKPEISNNGAQPFSDGTLPTRGVFQGGTVSHTPNTIFQGTGGRVSGCTHGSEYWRDRFSPCSDIGSQRFPTTSGGEISATPILQRGFKPNNLSDRNNGGNGTGTLQSGGGSGAVGGSIGENGQGGGGGAGYTNGEVTVVVRQEANGFHGPNGIANFRLLD